MSHVSDCTCQKCNGFVSESDRIITLREWNSLVADMLRLGEIYGWFEVEHALDFARSRSKPTEPVQKEGEQ